MTAKLLHTDSHIFFPDPIMVRVEFPSDQMSPAEISAAYRKIHRNTYKTIEGTWGYSRLCTEMIPLTDPQRRTLKSSVTANGWNPGNIVTIMADARQVSRGYFCFCDEMDVLQFMLTVDGKAVKVDMWPKNITFTIHEVSESAELTPYGAVAKSEQGTY
jgi:uncharacterized protein YfcZ (UPF0381/DUF406 family)